jgi:poly(ADP-ribose) glycohydrolase
MASVDPPSSDVSMTQSSTPVEAGSLLTRSPSLGHAIVSSASSSTTVTGSVLPLLHNTDAKRWETITPILKSIQQGEHSSTAQSIGDAIQSVGGDDVNHPRGLVEWLQDKNGFHHLTTEQTTLILEHTIPFIAQLALQLPDVCREPIPLLIQLHEATVDLSQQQVACLLAGAFFSLHPLCEPYIARELNYPNWENFLYVYVSEAQYGKFMCVMHYFERLRQRETSIIQKRTISIHRRVLSSQMIAETLSINVLRNDTTTRMGQFEFFKDGCIEDGNDGCLQVDFANCYIGGGVLETGCVQEEIRFVINPECLVSLLLCPKMLANESIVIVGAERFSHHTGYARSFRWKGPAYDKTPSDDRGRLQTTIVAIDALMAWQTNQFSLQGMQREIVKAYAGFSCPVQVICDSKHTDALVKDVIATGGWGTGAFGGHVHLKAILQWIASTLSGRTLRYFSFSNPLADQLGEFAVAVMDKGCTVGVLLSAVLECRMKKSDNLFQMLSDKLELNLTASS